MARKVKLSKTELLDRNIERWETKQEAAVIMLRKSAEELLKLRRQRARHQRKLLTETRAKAVELSKPVEIEQPKDDGVRFGPDEVVKRPQDVQPPKRRRKAPPGSERAALHHTPPSASDDRLETVAVINADGDLETKLTSMGFRKYKGRAKQV
jgi:hypothetical protein